LEYDDLNGRWELVCNGREVEGEEEKV
jgi:hypothetical protein